MWDYGNDILLTNRQEVAPIKCQVREHDYAVKNFLLQVYENEAMSLPQYMYVSHK